MRLICPNCDAQYEVPDEVIPTAGRDVQCSNCGKTWFQHHPEHLPQDDAADVTVPDPDEEIAPPPSPAPPKQPVRRELDDSVADILREEAQTEQAARRREADALESQPDLGLDGHDEDDAVNDARAREARERTARMRGQDTAADEVVTAAAISSRRDLLPDIEEINSTLRSTSDRGGAMDDGDIDAPTQRRKKRGFRTGLSIMLLLLVLALLIYIFAPQIADAIPALDGVMNNYVAWVDQLRLWLDGKVQGMLTWLDAMANKSAAG